MVNLTVPFGTHKILHHTNDQHDVTIQVEPYAQVTLFLKPDKDVAYTIHIADHASCTGFIFIDSDVNLNLYLELGQLARAEVKGICVTGNADKVSIKSTQHHKGIQASSALLIKSLLNNKAVFNYNGTIRIDPQASGSYAEQYNKNLICSSDAQACAIPSLEVLTHEVTCKHGSATAQLSEEHIVYLASRGMNNTAAQLLLKEAFCGEIVQSINDPLMQQEWYAMLKKGIINE